ncbi:unnamed protein product [Caenorhabditis sp. 36 PRJEB53466]|nr:unnamed protein product [Caenorhabditis sp. 36 PRJEB53466]
MNHPDDAFLMSSEIEDDLVIEEEQDREATPSEPSTSSANSSNVYNLDIEIDRILNTPWYDLTPDQAEVIHRLVSRSEALSDVDLRNSIEDSLLELAMIRGRNAELSQQN